MNWLARHFEGLHLEPNHEGYFLGRGAKEESLHRLQVKSWQNLTESAPNPEFTRRYGDKGERLEGWYLWPYLSPKGACIGFSGRKSGEKTLTRFLLPEAAWQPLWSGLSPEVMQNLWQGGEVWLVEGIFDVFPLEWVVPERDAVLASERALLTDKHVEFLRRYTLTHRQRVFLVYDNDDTGRKGVHGWRDENGKFHWGALQKLKAVGITALEVSYSGKDPGEVWLQGGLSRVQANFNL